MERFKAYILQKWKVLHPLLYKHRFVLWCVCPFLALMGVSRYMGEANRLLYYPSHISYLNLFFGAIEFAVGLFGVFIILLKEPKK